MSQYLELGQACDERRGPKRVPAGPDTAKVFRRRTLPNQCVCEPPSHRPLLSWSRQSLRPLAPATPPSSSRHRRR